MDRALVIGAVAFVVGFLVGYAVFGNTGLPLSHHHGNEAHEHTK